MWRVRRKNERGFDDGFHVQNGKGAAQLVELLNKQDDELTTVTEQRDRLAKALRKAISSTLETDEATLRAIDIDGGGQFNAVHVQVSSRLERERDEAREQLTAVTAQRDRLATILQNIRSGFGGQIPDPTCDCGDCEFLIKIDNALQYITKPKEL